MIDHLHLFRKNVHRRHRIVLGQQRCQRQSDITGSCHGDANRLLLPSSFRNIAAGAEKRIRRFLPFRLCLLSDCFLPEHILQIKPKLIAQRLQLQNGGDVFLRFDMTEHGPVDSRPVCQLLLRNSFFLTSCTDQVCQILL